MTNLAVDPYQGICRSSVRCIRHYALGESSTVPSARERSVDWVWKGQKEIVSNPLPVAANGPDPTTLSYDERSTDYCNDATSKLAVIRPLV